KEIRKIANDNRDVVKIVVDEDLQIQIRDRMENSQFIFKVYAPFYKNLKSYFKVYFIPGSTQSLDRAQLVATIEGGHSVIFHLKSWISLIRSYNTTFITPEEEILADYEIE